MRSTTTKGSFGAGHGKAHDIHDCIVMKKKKKKGCWDEGSMGWTRAAAAAFASLAILLRVPG